jgi:hypothetical protein
MSATVTDASRRITYRERLEMDDLDPHCSGEHDG